MFAFLAKTVLAEEFQGAVIMLLVFALTAYLLYALLQLSKGWGYADEA